MSGRNASTMKVEVIVMSNSSSKVISKIFVYVLVIGGAFLMLIPFAWMVATSFKAPSEVSSWPPVWTTKNAASSFQFKTQIRQKSLTASVDLSTLSLSEFRNFAALIGESVSYDTIIVNLNDDHIRRGEIEIQLLSRDGSPARYAVEIDEARFQGLIEEYEALVENLPAAYEKELKGLPVEDVGRFLDRFFTVAVYNDNGFIRRVTLVTTLKMQYNTLIERLKQGIENSLKELPVDSELTKELKKRLVENSLELLAGPVAGLEKTVIELDSYRTGATGVTSLEEIEKLVSNLVVDLSRMEEVSKSIMKLAAEAIESDSKLALPARQLERALEAAGTGLKQWADLLGFYAKLRRFYEDSQTLSLASASIVGRIRTDREVHELVVSSLDTLNADKDIKDHLASTLSPSNIRNAVTILINYLDRDFNRSLAPYYVNTQVVLETLNDAMNFIRTSLIVAGDRSLDQRVRSSMSAETSYEAIKSLIRDVASASGQTITVGSILASLDRHARNVDSDVFAGFIRRRWEETSVVGAFSRMHSDIFTELDLSIKPAEVEKVYFRGLTSPSGAKSFEIKLRGISAVWLKDDMAAGKANFNLSETFKNFFQNYITAWNAAPFGTYYFNTVFVAIVTTFLEIIFAAMAAFAFAKLEFFGKNLIFTLFLATMMVPGEVLLVPNFVTLTALGWIDTYYALIVPWVVSVFAIFLMRQHFMTIPNELYDAAMIDGLTKWRFLWTIMVPLAKPAVITGALLKFVGSWNSFLWVLIVTKSPEIRTLPVGLQNFSSAAGSDYHLLMAAATFSVIPVIALFLLTQKYFIAGIARSGLK